MDTEIVCYGGRVWCRWIEEVTVDVRFSADGCIVDRVKTFVEVDCEGGWGESKNGGDDE